MFGSRTRSMYPRSTFGSPFDLMGRFIGNFGDFHSATSYPALNVWAHDDGAVVTSELPGVKMDDIELTVHGKTLTLKGSRSEDSEKNHFVRRERPEGEFTRTIEVPFQIDGSKVEARMANGVLNITLPRAESDKPRKVAVNVS